jgi:hypothetical protein
MYSCKETGGGGSRITIFHPKRQIAWPYVFEDIIFKLEKLKSKTNHVPKQILLPLMFLKERFDFNVVPTPKLPKTYTGG